MGGERENQGLKMLQAHYTCWEVNWQPCDSCWRLVPPVVCLYKWTCLACCYILFKYCTVLSKEFLCVVIIQEYVQWEVCEKIMKSLVRCPAF
jgi:hypothetical protein